MRFSEHIRANMFEFVGEQTVYVIPVAGDGFVTLKNWPVIGGAGRLTVAELSRLKIDGHVAQFEKKVPYALTLDDASAREQVDHSDDKVLIDLSLSRFFHAELP